MEKRTEKTKKGDKMNNINNSTKIEMLCELAHNRTVEEFGETEISFNRNWRKEGSYIEEAQDIFNEYYDYYDSIILTYLKEKK